MRGIALSLAVAVIVMVALYPVVSAILGGVARVGKLLGG